MFTLLGDYPIAFEALDLLAPETAAVRIPWWRAARSVGPVERSADPGLGEQPDVAAGPPAGRPAWRPL